MIQLDTQKRQNGSLEFNWLPLIDRLFKEYEEILSSRQTEWIYQAPKTSTPNATRPKWLPRLCKAQK